MVYLAVIIFGISASDPCLALLIDMNRYGNSGASYDDDGHEYHTADGSRYVTNPDGSSVYDPCKSPKGTKWHRSQYIDDREEQYMGYAETHETKYGNQSYGCGNYPQHYQAPSYRVSPTPHYEVPTQVPDSRKSQTARCSRPGAEGYQYSLSQWRESHYEEEDSCGKKAIHISEQREKEVHVQFQPLRSPSPPPMNVTRVVHHSSKGEKEILYNTPAKLDKDGQVQKIEKVVHIHHHKDPR